MGQFDVYDIQPDGTLVVDVQSDLLDPLNTRVVIPLVPLGTTLKPAKRLNPVVRIADKDQILATQFVAAVPVSELKTPVSSLAEHKDDITAALDMLYQGF
ncbi:CcdB family protein [Tateyamaria sp. syn59]|uniref:CcdB family protein n=1 Tax=Tateyamaria sp. syn59 TaxID=2576942 RepID=UPI0011BD92C6|nr:CcdB family protein [Tateyamaria sp. syn59]